MGLSPYLWSCLQSGHTMTCCGRSRSKSTVVERESVKQAASCLCCGSGFTSRSWLPAVPSGTTSESSQTVASRHGDHPIGTLAWSRQTGEECSQSAKATVIGHEPLSNDELNNLMVHTLHLVLLHSLSLSLSSGRCCPIAPTTVSKCSCLVFKMSVPRTHLVVVILVPIGCSRVSHTHYSGSLQLTLSHALN